MQALCACALCKLVCASCSAQVLQVLCASCSAQVAPRKCCRSSWECTSRNIFALKVATSKGHFAKIARRHSESASIRTISAEGSPRLRRIRRHSERASTRTISAEGSSGNVKNAKKPRVFAPRTRRSPQRVARAPQKTQNNLEFLHLDHADLRRGSCGQIKKRKKPRVFAPRPRRSPQRVARAPQKTQNNLEFLHLDHADLRRGPRGHRKKTPKKKTRVFAPRPRRSPQRVAFPIVGNIPTPRFKRDS